MTATPAAKPQISAEAVRTKTGKSWDDWFALLDAVPADRMSHKEIVAHLKQFPELSAWWRQSVAVAYEQARGMRAPHQAPDGYQVSAARTIGVPVAKLFQAWQDEGLREAWLPENPLKIRTSTPSKSLRITWRNGTHISVTLYPRGDARSQVSLQHTKLPDADAVTSYKAFWSNALTRLKNHLEA